MPLAKNFGYETTGDLDSRPPPVRLRIVRAFYGLGTVLRSRKRPGGEHFHRVPTRYCVLQSLLCLEIRRNVHFTLSFGKGWSIAGSAPTGTDALGRNNQS